MVADGVLEEGVLHLEGGVVAVVEGVDAGGVDVEAEGGELGGEEACQGEAYVAEAHHTYLYVTQFNHISEATVSISSSVI